MKYVFFDTETTGLNYGKDDVIQLAYIVLDDNMNIVDAGCNYCNTDVAITKEAYNVHHIDKKFLEEHAGSTFLNDLIVNNKYFNGEVKDVVFMAYNVEFDSNMINQKLRKRGYRGVDFGPYTRTPNQVKSGRYHFCMMNGLKNLRRWPHRKRLKQARKIILKSVSDETIRAIYKSLVDNLNLDVREGSEYHDALYDTLITALLYTHVRKDL